MANAFSKSDIIFFEDVIAGFDNNNIVAKNTSMYSPNMQVMEQSDLTINRPMPQISTSSTGRDVSSDYKDINELVVPSTLAESDILNVPFTMTAVELNDPGRRTRKVESAVRQLSAGLDKKVGEQVFNYGTQVVTSTTALDTYEELAAAEAVLLEQGVSESYARCMFLNPRDAKSVASNLANRETMNRQNLSAYERSKLLPVAGFDTFRATILPTLTGSSASGVTVDGADQNTTPAVNTDNRTQTLTVSAAHGLVAGDCFTLANVYAVNMETKQSTGQLQTFRVISVATNDLTISPAIIPADGAAEAQKQYANVTTTPADTAAVTVLNSSDKMASLFYVKDAVEIIHGRLAVEDLGGNVSIMRETTDSGIEIIFAKQGGIDDLTVKYRLSMWAGANVLQPQMAGILLGSQT